eukprot:scaffold608311_cov114-Attheya_sp.AAC.3
MSSLSPAIKVNMSLLGSPQSASTAHNKRRDGTRQDVSSSRSQKYHASMEHQRQFSHPYRSDQYEKKAAQISSHVQPTKNVEDEQEEEFSSPRMAAVSREETNDYTTEMLVREASSMIREMESYRDEMKMFSVKNAILLDELAMSGSD